MKKVIVAAAFVLSAGMVHAQTAATATVTPAPAAMQQRAMPSPEEMAKKQTDRMATMLNLNEDQKKNMYQANLDITTKVMAARKTKDKMAFDQAMVDRDARYKKILTPDQYTKYSQMMPQHNMRPAGAPGMMGKAPTAPAPAPVK